MQKFILIIASFWMYIACIHAQELVDSTSISPPVCEGSYLFKLPRNYPQDIESELNTGIRQEAEMMAVLEAVKLCKEQQLVYLKDSTKQVSTTSLALKASVQQAVPAEYYHIRGRKWVCKVKVYLLDEPKDNKEHP